MISASPIETFLSRPNWIPQVLEDRLVDLYKALPKLGFKANTIGRTDVPLQSPFEDVRRLMGKCECSVILGLPQIFITDGRIKDVTVKTILPTEWNQIECTMSLMLNLPTLVLLHNAVLARGIFERGAANVFVHDFDLLKPDWLDRVKVALDSLKNAVRR